MIAAAPSGEATEYTACSSIRMRSATPKANAPPLPPSPITAQTMGTRSEAIVARLLAIARLTLDGRGLQLDEIERNPGLAACGNDCDVRDSSVQHRQFHAGQS